MKILHINNFYHKGGGTEIYIDRISRELQRLGNEVLILYGVQPIAGTEVIGYKGIFVPDVHKSKEKSVLSYVKEVIEKESVDIIYLHNIFNFALIEAIEKVRPLLKLVHDHNFYCPGGLQYFPKINKTCTLKYHPLRCFLLAYLTRCASRHPLRLCRKIYQCGNILAQKKSFDGFVVFSHVMKECLERNGIEGEMISVIYHFTKPLSSSRKNKDTSMLLYVGRISHGKGVECLLDIVEGLSSDYRLVIAGDGYYLPQVKKKAVSLGISHRIEFKGWLSETELNDYYSRASVLIFPSLWSEPFGMAGIEAMSHGIPVVAFNSGAVSEWLIDQETGFLVETGDIIDMRKKIELLLQDTQLASNMGVKGKMRVEKYFTIERHVSHLLTATSEAIKHYHNRMGELRDIC